MFDAHRQRLLSAQSFETLLQDALGQCRRSPDAQQEVERKRREQKRSLVGSDPNRVDNTASGRPRLGSIPTLANHRASDQRKTSESAGPPARSIHQTQSSVHKHRGCWYAFFLFYKCTWTRLGQVVMNSTGLRGGGEEVDASEAIQTTRRTVSELRYDEAGGCPFCFCCAA